MYIEGNIETILRNNFYRTKEICNQLVWVFVPLIIQNE